MRLFRRSFSECPSRALLSAVVAVVLMSAPALGQDRRESLFGVLDRENGASAVRRATQHVARLGMDVGEVQRFLREGRAYPPAPTGFRKAALSVEGGDPSPAWVFVPEQYDPAERWPLVVALHGRGQDGGAMYGWLSGHARRRGMLLIAPTAPRRDDLSGAATGPDAPPPERWWRSDSRSLALVALRWMKRRYNVDEDRVFLLGQGMGGYAAWNVGMRFSDRFAALAPISGALKRPEVPGPLHATARRLLRNLRGVAVWTAVGAADRDVPLEEARDIHRELNKLEIEHAYREIPGVSNSIAAFALPGSKLAQELFDWLVRQRRRLDSRRVRWVGLSPDHGSAGWIKVEKIRSSAAGLEAWWTAPGELSVRALGVKRLRVFLPEEWSAESGALTITVRTGTERTSTYEYEVPEASLGALLESWSLREDRRQVFSRSVLVIVREGGAVNAEPRTPSRAAVLPPARTREDKPPATSPEKPAPPGERAPENGGNEEEY